VRPSSGVRYKISIALHVISVLLFMASLTQPAYEALTTNGPSVNYGLFALLFGVVGHKSWFANPLLFFAWVMFFKGNGYVSSLVAVVALGVSLTFLPEDQKVVVGSMGAYPYQAMIGYYIWLSSLVTAIVSGLVHGYQVNTTAAASSDA
jgi:hypothetical protein